MEIVKSKFSDPQVKFFESLCKQEWPKDFSSGIWSKNVKNLPDINDQKVYLALNSGNVIGGAVINKNWIVNTFEDPKKTARAQELRDQGFENFTYFIMASELRGKGLGTLFLKEIQKHHPKIWIKSEVERISFYQKNKFKIDIPSTQKDKYPVMTCQI